MTTTAKRSYHQAAEEPWLRYPDSNSSRKPVYSRAYSPVPAHGLGKYQHSSHNNHNHTNHADSHYHRQDHLDQSRHHSHHNLPQQQARFGSSTTSLASSTASAAANHAALHQNNLLPKHRHRHLQDELDSVLSSPPESTFGMSEDEDLHSMPRGPTLAEELAMSSSSMSGSATLNDSNSSTSSGNSSGVSDGPSYFSSHFPLQQHPTSSFSSSSSRPRPAPLSINTSLNSSSTTFITATPTSMVSRDSGSDSVDSPRSSTMSGPFHQNNNHSINNNNGHASLSFSLTSATAPPGTLGSPATMPRLSMGSRSSVSNSSSTSSPISMSPPGPCLAFCNDLHQSSQHLHPHSHHSHHSHHQKSLRGHHHPACPHQHSKHSHGHHPHYHGHRPVRKLNRSKAPSMSAIYAQQEAALRDTEVDDIEEALDALDTNDSVLNDDDHLASTIVTPAPLFPTSTSGYGIGAYKEALSTATSSQSIGLMASSSSSDSGILEPPKKRMRAAASMLFGVAVETVIFTGAVALSAYQLLTGRTGLLSSSPPPLLTEQPQQKDEFLSEKKSLDSNRRGDGVGSDFAMDGKNARMSEDLSVLTPPGRTSFGDFDLPPPPTSEPLTRSSSYPRHGYQEHRKGRSSTGRQFKSRQQVRLDNILSHHTRSPSTPMPERPNTGTEDSDEAFLRMEAQLSNLIAEGKKALSRKIELWDDKVEDL